MVRHSRALGYRRQPGPGQPDTAQPDTAIRSFDRQAPRLFFAGGRVIRSIAEAVRGWLYLLAFITGGNYVRKARLKRLGRGVKISPTAFFKYPEMIEIGDHSFINHLCSVWASPAGPITIGNNVLLGPCVSIFSSNHGIARGELIRNQPGQDAPISIGDDVWLGANAVVTAGVSIGEGAVVGAGAVVTGDLPPMSISAGVPARVIGYRP